MGFGAAIATGDDNAVLSEPLAECLIEVRVEQSLDEPARFGIRVREDISKGEGQYMAASAPELMTDRILTVAVETGTGLRGLVRGPITRSRTQLTLGGPGSWFEVQGEDRRVELGRQCFHQAWEGRASDAARAVLAGAGFTPEVQDTDRIYSRTTETLNQRGTDLDFLKTIARQNAMSLWLEYQVSRSGLDPTSRRFTVKEIANVKTSPFRALGPGGVPPSIAGLPLAATAGVRIRTGPGSECGNNVTSFELNVDVERATSFDASAVDTRSVRADSTSASDPATSLQRGGRALAQVSGRQRQPCVTAAGDAEDVRRRGEAVLNDAGWFVTARASTTAHMLGGVLVPHDLVTVDGLGPKHSGVYRVKSVVHVITAADHFMDLELQTNAVS